ncbi:hypothetical protein Trihar35433_8447 [Trichoderma harzianum]|nr:hypothetical protein Trihar35433_8447 [Trichoderma harzianum]
MPSYVVVGASRGLGYQWLKTLSADKDNVVIGLVRTPAPVHDKLAADGIKNIHLLQADLVDNQSLTAAASEVSKLTGGSVDYLIVNAAYQNHKAASLTPTSFIGQEDVLVKEMRQYLDVGVIGVIQTINAFLPLIRKSATKKIIAISSGMADFDFVGKAEIAFGVSYGATKAALNLVIIKYGIELKDEGVVVLALSPGLIDTREEPPTEDEIAGFLVLLKKFQAIYPNFSGPISAEESREVLVPPRK